MTPHPQSDCDRCQGTGNLCNHPKASDTDGEACPIDDRDKCDDKCRYMIPCDVCQSPAPPAGERDTVLNEKELQYLNCLIKKDIIDYPKGWCTLPHVEPTLQQNVLKKIESLRITTPEAHR